MKTVPPIYIMMLIHYYAINEPYPASHAPACKTTTERLLRAGLIYDDEHSKSGYRATEKGETLVRVLTGVMTFALQPIKIK